MVQVIPQTPGFGERLGQKLSSGLEYLLQTKVEGLQKEKQLELASQLKREEQKAKMDQLMQLLGASSPLEEVEVGEEVIAPSSGEEGGLSDKQILGVSLVDPTLGRLLQSQKESKERASEKLADTRYKTNLPLFNEAVKKVKSAESEGLSIQRLQELNESDKLPKGLGRLNVNLSSGELRLPFLANPETQAFVKTINDFTTKAKDSFGARVTNFELNRFMKRLPTLLNTTEGRRTILRQMEIINQLNTLEQQGILDVFDQEGGVRKIDYDQAERKSKKSNKSAVEKLKKEFLSLDADAKSLSRAPGNKIQKVKKGTPLTEEIAREIRQKAGSKEKAEKMARQLGYEF